MATKKIDEVIAIILLISIVLMLFCILIGEWQYLHANTSTVVNRDFFQQAAPLSWQTIKTNIHYPQASFYLIAGFLILIITQLLRVFLLAVFYYMKRDSIFFSISLYICVILISGLLW